MASQDSSKYLRTGRELNRTGSPTDSKEADQRLAIIEQELNRARIELKKLRHTAETWAQANAQGAEPVTPSAPELIVQSPDLGLHWLQDNYPEQDEAGAEVYPVVKIRATLPGDIHLENSLYTCFLAVWATADVKNPSGVVIRSDAIAHSILMTVGITSAEVVNGYCDFTIPKGQLVVGQVAYCLLVALAASGGYAETTYSDTERRFTAGNGLEAPETPDIDLRLVTQLLSKFRFRIGRDWDATKPYVNACNFYDKLEVWTSPDATAGQTPDVGAGTWEIEHEIPLQGMVKRIKAKGTHVGVYKNFSVKHKAGQLLYCASRIKQTDGQYGPWIAFSTTGVSANSPGYICTNAAWIFAGTSNKLRYPGDGLSPDATDDPGDTGVASNSWNGDDDDAGKDWVEVSLRLRAFFSNTKGTAGTPEANPNNNRVTGTLKEARPGGKVVKHALEAQVGNEYQLHGSGTVAVGALNVITDANSAYATDGRYNGSVIRVISDTGEIQSYTVLTVTSGGIITLSSNLPAAGEYDYSSCTYTDVFLKQKLRHGASCLVKELTLHGNGFDHVAKLNVAFVAGGGAIPAPVTPTFVSAVHRTNMSIFTVKVAVLTGVSPDLNASNYKKLIMYRWDGTADPSSYGTPATNKNWRHATDVNIQDAIQTAQEWNTANPLDKVDAYVNVTLGKKSIKKYPAICRIEDMYGQKTAWSAVSNTVDEEMPTAATLAPSWFDTYSSNIGDSSVVEANVDIIVQLAANTPKEKVFAYIDITHNDGVIREHEERKLCVYTDAAPGSYTTIRFRHVCGVGRTVSLKNVEVRYKGNSAWTGADANGDRQDLVGYTFVAGSNTVPLIQNFLVIATDISMGLCIEAHWDRDIPGDFGDCEIWLACFGTTGNPTSNAAGWGTVKSASIPKVPGAKIARGYANLMYNGSYQTPVDYVPDLPGQPVAIAGRLKSTTKGWGNYTAIQSGAPSVMWLATFGSTLRCRWYRNPSLVSISFFRRASFSSEEWQAWAIMYADSRLYADDNEDYYDISGASAYKDYKAIMAYVIGGVTYTTEAYLYGLQNPT